MHCTKLTNCAAAAKHFAPSKARNKKYGRNTVSHCQKKISLLNNEHLNNYSKTANDNRKFEKIDGALKRSTVARCTEQQFKHITHQPALKVQSNIAIDFWKKG
jgi:hypothetical protein